MTAREYSVDFPYGATSDPYSKASPHRGDDYPTWDGVPIVIGSTTIGTTGRSGYVTGPHLHVQEWQGNPANTRKPQNAFKGGTVIAVDANPNQGSWGRYITIQKDGWNTTYAHLESVNVRVGQVITGDEMIEEKDLAQIRIIMSEVEGWNGHEIHAGKHDKMILGWVGKTWEEFIQHGWNVQPRHRVYIEEENAQLKQQLADVQTALTDEQDKPPKEIVKTLTQIVKEEVIVPQIVEKPFTDKDGVNWLTSLIRRIFKK